MFPAISFLSDLKEFSIDTPHQFLTKCLNSALNYISENVLAFVREDAVAFHSHFHFLSNLIKDNFVRSSLAPHLLNFQ